MKRFIGDCSYAKLVIMVKQGGKTHNYPSSRSTYSGSRKGVGGRPRKDGKGHAKAKVVSASSSIRGHFQRQQSQSGNVINHYHCTLGKRARVKYSNQKFQFLLCIFLPCFFTPASVKIVITSFKYREAPEIFLFFSNEIGQHKVSDGAKLRKFCNV